MSLYTFTESSLESNVTISYTDSMQVPLRYNLYSYWAY